MTTHTPSAAVRRCMQSNRSKGTKIEVLLAKELWHRGLRYRLNDRSLPGTPDISFKHRRLAVFCDGEFWHGRNWEQNKYRIHTNRPFWWAKIERNRLRDQRVNAQLQAMGWRVLRFWESDLRHNLPLCADQVEEVWRQTEQRHLHRTYQFDTQYDSLVAESDLEWDD